MAVGTKSQRSKILIIIFIVDLFEQTTLATLVFVFENNKHALVRCVFSNKTERKYSMIVVRQTQPTVCFTVSNFKIMHHATVQSHFTDYFSPFIQKLEHRKTMKGTSYV